MSPGERDRDTLTVPVRIYARADQAQPLRRQCRLRHRHRRARPVRLGQSAGQHAWASLAHRTDCFRDPLRIPRPLHDPGRRPRLEKLEFTLGYIDEDIGDLAEQAHRAHRRTDPGRSAAGSRCCSCRLNDERTDLPGRQRQPGAAADPRHQLREPAAELPDRLGARCRVLRRAVAAARPRSARTRRTCASMDAPNASGRSTGPWHVRGRGEFGTSWVDDFSALPASQRFFAGGDRSVRGFALNELSPPLDRGRRRAPSHSGQGGGGEHKVVGQHRARAGLSAQLPRRRLLSTPATPSTTGARRSSIPPAWACAGGCRC